MNKYLVKIAGRLPPSMKATARGYIEKARPFANDMVFSKATKQDYEGVRDTLKNTSKLERKNSKTEVGQNHLLTRARALAQRVGSSHYNELAKRAAMISPASTLKKVVDKPLKGLMPIQNDATKDTAKLITKGK